MNDPWSILELTPESADEKAVRSAYARLLKVHRPDQDPAGFKQLRQAYEEALAWLRSSIQEQSGHDEILQVLASHSPVSQGAIEAFQGHEADDSDVDSQDDTTASSLDDSWNWPKEWTYGIESLQLAVQRVKEHPSGVTMALYALGMDAEEFAMPARVLDQIIFHAFGPRIGWFAFLAPSFVVDRLVASGAVNSLDASLAGLKGPQYSQHRILIANSIEGIPVEAITSANFEFLCRLAIATAFDTQSSARKLQQKLYLKPEAGSFRPLLTELRDILYQCSLIQSLSENSRLFWKERLTAPETHCDWRHSDAVNALREVVLKGRHWSGAALLQKVVPNQVWKRAWGSRSLLLFKQRFFRFVKSDEALVTGAVAVSVGFFVVLGSLKSKRQANTRLPMNPEIERIRSNADFEKYVIRLREHGLEPTDENLVLMKELIDLGNARRKLQPSTPLPEK